MFVQSDTICASVKNIGMLDVFVFWRSFFTGIYIHN